MMNIKSGFPHHLATIENTIRYFQPQREVQALLLGGSIAHGYATEKSDVDILIVVSEDMYEARKHTNTLLFYNAELSTYEGGYVDGKYITLDYIHMVAERGNEPTRYAFKDAVVLFSQIQGLDEFIKRSSAFPLAEKQERFNRLYAQMHAWKWFYYQGLSHQNIYLQHTAVQNFVFYASRVILNINERLYPYHKWLMQEVSSSPIKPETFLTEIEHLIKNATPELIEKICGDVKNLVSHPLEDWDWPQYFARDVETPWMHQEPFISDI